VVFVKVEEVQVFAIIVDAGHKKHGRLVYVLFVSKRRAWLV
jgi:hypothetical protein